MVYKAPIKRSQHFNATYHNIVRRKLLRAFGNPFAACGDLLWVVGSILKMVKFNPTTPNCYNMSQQGGQTHSTCSTLLPTMLRYVALKCYDRRFVGGISRHTGSVVHCMHAVITDFQSINCIFAHFTFLKIS